MSTSTTTTRSWLLVLSIVLLGGCGATVHEQMRDPIHTATKTVSRADRTGACLGLNRMGVAAPTAPGEGEELVGYENRFVRGADPFPCNHRQNYDHQAAVKFDLEDLVARRALVTEAILEVSARFIPLMARTEISRDCRMRLLYATAPWAPADALGGEADPRVQLSTTGNIEWVFPGAGETARKDVTAMVQQWLSGRRINHGFVLRSPAEHSLADETLSCVYGLSNFHLRLKVLEPGPGV